MRIFAAGIATETNTFCPTPTAEKDFIVQRGRDALAGKVEYPFLDLSQLWREQADAIQAGLIFSLNAFAQPSGITLRSAYEKLRDDLLEDLRAALPVDVVLLMLHGAMIVDGYENSEEDLVGRIRDVVGLDTVIGVELDLHCHLTQRLIDLADLIVTYKEYPHIDVNHRARELFDWSVAAALARIRPTMALFDCRMIGLYPTSRQPLRGIVDAMSEAERRKGVLSVSFAHSFPFADVARVGAKVLAVTDNDPALALEVARELGLRVYGARREIGFESFSHPMEQALSLALASTEAPVVVADQSDNVGAGAPGDSTFALRWLLEVRAERVAVAIVHDPEVVEVAKHAGTGARIQVRLGGKSGADSGEPLDIAVTVEAIRSRYVHSFPQQSGRTAEFPVGDVVALRAGGIRIVVGSERCQCYSPGIFSDLSIDPCRQRVLVVKSAQHFHGAFAPIAAKILYMAAPGAVVPDPRRIAYRQVDTRRFYPWTDDPLGVDSLTAAHACSKLHSA